MTPHCHSCKLGDDPPPESQPHAPSPTVTPEENARAWAIMDQFFAPEHFARWAEAERQRRRHPSGPNTAARLRAIQHATGNPELAALADEVAAIEDRLLLAEAALHHIYDAIGLDPSALPDPFRPRLYASADSEELPL